MISAQTNEPMMWLTGVFALSFIVLGLVFLKRSCTADTDERQAYLRKVRMQFEQKTQEFETRRALVQKKINRIMKEYPNQNIDSLQRLVR